MITDERNFVICDFLDFIYMWGHSRSTSLEKVGRGVDEKGDKRWHGGGDVIETVMPLVKFFPCSFLLQFIFPFSGTWWNSDNITVKRNKNKKRTMRCNNGDDLLHINFTSNLYEGAFIAKIVIGFYCKVRYKWTLNQGKIINRCSLGFYIRLGFLKTPQTLHFLNYFTL